MSTKVLHILSSLDSRTGGPVTSILGLAPAQARIGISVSVLATNHVLRDGAPNARRLLDAGVKVKLLGPAYGKRTNHPAIQSECRAAIADADIVHIHGIWEVIQKEAARVARTTGKPYIFRPCGMLDPWSRGRRKWLKELVLMAGLRKEIAASSALHLVTRTEEMGTGPLYPKTPKIVEPNGVDLERLLELKPNNVLRRRIGIDDNIPILLFLGRIHHKKGLDFLIRAAGHLARSQTEFQLIIAGPGTPQILRELQDLIQAEGLERRVHFTGMMDAEDKLQALSAADIFVLPSRHENFGVSVAEAMAAGVPVIVSDQVALCHEVIASSAGSVVPLNAPHLAEAIRIMLGSSEERARAGRAGRAFAAEHFSWDSIAARWDTRYRDLVHGM